MIVWRTIFTRAGEPPAWYFDAKKGDAIKNAKALKDECKRDGFAFEVEGPTEIKISSRQALAAVLEATAILDTKHVGDLSMPVSAQPETDQEGDEP